MAFKDLIQQFNGRKDERMAPVDKIDMPKTEFPDKVMKEQINTQAPSNPPAQSGKPDYFNKWGYSESDMQALAKAGYTPDRLERFNAEYDPSKSGSYLQRIYEASIPQPTAPDEKKIRNAKIAGGLGDALGLLSQMWSAGKGAHVRERDYKNSGLARTLANEKELRNIYLQQQNKYDEGLYNIKLKDLLSGRNEHEAGQKGIRDVLDFKQKQEQLQSQFEAKQRYNYDRLNQDKEKADAAAKLARDRFSETARHNKKMEGISGMNAQTNRMRANAWIEKSKSGGGGGGKGGGSVLYLPANPHDKKNKVIDKMGQKVVALPVTKDEQLYYAREAMKDKKFLERHPELILGRPDMTGEGSYKYANEDKIAAAYIQELYESGFDSDLESLGPLPPRSMQAPDFDSAWNQNQYPSYTEEENDEDWTWED